MLTRHEASKVRLCGQKFAQIGQSVLQGTGLLSFGFVDMIERPNIAQQPWTGTAGEKPGREGIPANEVAGIITSANRIARLDDPNDTRRQTVEFVRDALGIERVALFLVNATKAGVVLHGSWGTSSRRRTADEREIVHSCAQEQFDALRTMPERGLLWQHHAVGPYATRRQREESLFEDRDWVAVTPLAVGGDIIGLMYNDTAISRSSFDYERQTRLALFANLIAGCIRGPFSPAPTTAKVSGCATQPCRFIQKVMAELQRNPGLTGKALAHRFRVTPGHLATTFKEETGVSIVEYRNRLRLESFFTLVRRGERNMLAAALEAGFGSYAQFHRVHWRVTGSAPSVHKGAGTRRTR